MRHHDDSLEALLATLAWRRAKRKAKRWAMVIPFLTLPFLMPWLELSRQAPVKTQEAAVIGPWMLPVKAEPPVVLGPWMLRPDRSSLDL
jgi:hypothetical protein